jgi:hypothetical protein
MAVQPWRWTCCSRQLGSSAAEKKTSQERLTGRQRETERSPHRREEARSRKWLPRLAVVGARDNSSPASCRMQCLSGEVADMEDRDESVARCCPEGGSRWHCSCFVRSSALAGIDRRLLLGSTVGSCWDRPQAAR